MPHCHRIVGLYTYQKRVPYRPLSIGSHGQKGISYPIRELISIALPYTTQKRPLGEKGGQESHESREDWHQAPCADRRPRRANRSRYGGRESQ